jgi:hypothetical protein
MIASTTGVRSITRIVQPHYCRLCGQCAVPYSDDPVLRVVQSRVSPDVSQNHYSGVSPQTGFSMKSSFIYSTFYVTSPREGVASNAAKELE